MPYTPQFGDDPIQDDDVMPWGKHRDTRLRDVPLDYLHKILSGMETKAHNLHVYLQAREAGTSAPPAPPTPRQETNSGRVDSFPPAPAIDTDDGVPF